MSTRDWKVTVSYADDAVPLAKDGARYLMRTDSAFSADAVASLTIRDAVARQSLLAPWKNMRYISVGVWDTSAADGPTLIACYTARWRSVDRPDLNGVLCCYEHPFGGSIEPMHQGANRIYIDPNEWEKS